MDRTEAALALLPPMLRLPSDPLVRTADALTVLSR